MQKRSLSVLFIFLQLVFTYYLIVQIWVNINQVNYQEREFVKHTNNILPSQIYTIWALDDIRTGEQVTNFLELEGDIDKAIADGLLNEYGSYDLVELPLKDPLKFREWNERLQSAYGKSRFRTEAILTDFSIYGKMRIGVKLGRGLTEEDFHLQDHHAVPILIGAGLEDIFSIGDQLELIGGEAGQSYMGDVVGILESGTHWVNEDFFIGNFLDMEYRMILPYIPMTRDTHWMDVSIRSSRMIVTADGEPENVIAELSNMGKKRGIPLIIEQLSKNIEIHAIRLQSYVIESLVTSGILLIVAIAGIVTTTIFSLTQRKYELGIRMSLGFTKFQIWEMVLFELGFLNGLAATLVYSVIYLIERSTMLEDIYTRIGVLTDSITIVGILLTMTMILSVSVFIPWLVIRRYTIIDLIRKDE